VSTQYIPQHLISPPILQQATNTIDATTTVRPLVLIVSSSVPTSVRSYIVNRLHNELPGLFSAITTTDTAAASTNTTLDTMIAKPTRSIKQSLMVPPVVRTCISIQTVLSSGTTGVIVDGQNMPIVGLSASARAEFCATIQGLSRCTIPKPSLLLLTAPDYASNSSATASSGNTVESKLQNALHTAHTAVALAKSAAAQAPFVSLSQLTQPPSAAHILALQAVMILTAPLGTVFPVPQVTVNQGGVAWSAARRVLTTTMISSSSRLCDRMAAVDIDAILPVNIIALNGYVSHNEWPKTVWCGMHDDIALSVMITWVTAVTEYATLLQVRTIL
jgi:hypothetical protein